jgi:hypothetical protein
MHDIAAVGAIVLNDLENHLAPLARLASDVGQQEQTVTEQPSEPQPVDVDR